VQPDDEQDSLYVEYFETRDPRVRDRLFDANGGLARALAQRFVRPSYSLDDLLQVAFLGLIKALDGFDPTRGLRFSTYAVPTIVGELKRHLRDQSWDIRPPRRVHDLYLAVERTADDLAQGLGRPPTLAEIGHELGISGEQVVDAMAAAAGRHLPSLEAPVEDTVLADWLGSDDERLERVDGAMVFEALMGHLPAVDRRLVRMRFADDMSQSQIAREVGRSQMSVSRALTRSLDRLRSLHPADLVGAE
jgi:RNA polymerase sigma-B factor